MFHIHEILICDNSGKPSADEHTESVSGKCKQPLGGTLDFFPCFLFSVHVACNKEEIIANSMKNNACIQHPNVSIEVTKGKTNVTKYPRDYTYHQNSFYSDTVK